MSTAITNDYYIPFFLKSTLNKIIFVAFVYNVLAFLSFRITVSPENISPIFPEAGFALAAIIIIGRNALIGIWVGSFIANMFSFWDVCKMLDKSLFETIFVAGSVATAVAISSAIAYYLTNFCNKKRYPLRNGFAVIILLGIGFIYCAICSFLGVATISYFELNTPNHFISNWTTWWQGNFIGTIILTPFIISWFYRHHIKIISTSIIEAIALGLATIFVCVLVAFDHSDDQYLFIIILLWASFRFRIRGVSILASLFALLSSIYGYLGYGSFVVITSNDSLLYLNSFFGLSTIIALIISGFYSDHLHNKLKET